MIIELQLYKKFSVFFLYMYIKVCSDKMTWCRDLFLKTSEKIGGRLDKASEGKS